MKSIVDDLRQRICSGEFAPGAPLRQESIAAELGVSRMPVRDALNQLQAEGLVDVFPNRGAFVASMSEDDCREIFDLRVLVECDALAHAVPKHDARSLRRLHDRQRALEDEDETARWASGDREFHEALYAPCGRRRTLELIASLRNVVERFYLANLTHDTHRKGWKKEHRDILRALAAGDASLACEKLRVHLRETEKVVLAALCRNT